jgi:hypothetical protein
MIVIPLPLHGRIPRRIGIAAAMVGGLLILLEGLLYPSSGLAQLAQVAMIVGGSIVALTIVADLHGRYRPLLGGLIIVLSLASLFGLSGYLFGALLGSLGGTLIVLTPSFSSSFPRGKPAFSSADLGPPCPSCGKHVPPWTSICPYCSSST